MSTGKTYSTKYLLDSKNNRGAEGQVLSSTDSGIDWVTLSEISGVDGTGTANYLSKWLDANTITNSLVYDNGTSVGIGTTSPTEKLEVAGNVKLTGNLNVGGYIHPNDENGNLRIFGGNDTTNDAQILLHGNSDSWGSLEFNYGYDSTNSFLKISQGSNEHLRITNGGKVGIGTTSPSQKLDVNGVGSFVGGTVAGVVDTQSAGIYLSTTGRGLSANFSGYARNLINHLTGGIIEIGQSTSLINHIKINAGSSGTNGIVTLLTKGAEQMRINASGNVGIGTTSPHSSSKLHVNGQIRAGATSDFTQAGSTAAIVAAKNFSYGQYSPQMNGSLAVVNTNTAGTAGFISLAAYYGNTNNTIYSAAGIGGGKETTVGDGGWGGYLNFFTTSDGSAGAASGAFEHMRITADGNVGIGTTSPSQKLEVNGAVLAGDYRGSSHIYLTSPDSWIFRSTGGTERMRLTSSGNVGIGEASPAQKLEVAGNAQITASDPRLVFEDTSGSTYNADWKYKDNIMRFVWGGGEKFSISSNGGITIGQTYTASAAPSSGMIVQGNVGIGTTSPAYSLHVETGGNTTVLSRTTSNAASAAFTTWNNNGSSGNYMQLKSYGQGVSGTTFGVNVSKTNMLWSSGDTLMAVGTIGTTPLIFGTSNAERLRINSSGNVGIGTTSPTAPLTFGKSVYGGTSSENFFRIKFKDNGGIQNDVGIGQSDVNSLEFNKCPAGIFSFNDGTNGEVMRINASGNVGIGTTSPSTRLQVASPTATSVVLATSYSPTNTNNFFEAGIVANDGYLTLRNSGVVSTVHIDSDGDSYLNGGNVGIGTNNPSNTLDIAGGLEVNAEAYIRSTNNVGLRIQTTDQGITGTDGLRVGLNATHAFVWQYENLPLSFGTNGSQKATILANGNFGIATTSPQVELHVGTATLGTAPDTNADIISSGGITIENTKRLSFDTAYYVHGNIKYNGTVSSVTEAKLEYQGYYGHNFITRSSSRMVIKGDTGNVGIGTTSPSEKLDITGGYLKFNGGDYGLKGSASLTYNPVSDHYFQSSGITKVVFKASGNVGIGTVSPDEALEVQGIIKSENTGYTNTGIIINQTSHSDAWRLMQFGGGAFSLNLNGYTSGESRFQVDTSGNVSIPTGTLTVSGGINGTSASFSEGVKANQGFANNVNGLRLSYPSGGIFTGQSSSQTGAIKITLPQSWTSTMMRMTIKVYEYTTNESFTLVCGGYNYSGNSQWFNHFAYIESSAKDDRNFTVRFGHDGTKCCIYIGELTGTWSYPQIYVTDFEAGYSNTTASLWQTGWNVGFEASAFGTVTKTEADCQINNWARSGQNIYFSSGTGKVGIGTVGTESKLHIVDANSSTQLRLNQSGNNDAVLGSGTNFFTIKTGTAGNTNALSILHSNQNVGIGTISPNTKLEISDSAAPNLRLQSTTSNAGNSGTLEFREADTNYGAFIKYDGDANFLKIGTRDSGTDYNRIVVNRGNGNVGIGESSPQEKLHVGGDIRVGAGGASDYNRVQFTRAGGSNVGAIGWHSDDKFYIGGHPSFGATAGNDVRVYGFGGDLHLGDNSNGDVLNIQYSSGNVGIGTASPQNKLHVVGTKIRLDTNSGGFYQYTAGGAFRSALYDDSSKTYLFADGDGVTPHMTFDGGNVGIGTTNPQATLHVNGDLSADNITSISNGGSASIYINSTRPTLGFTDSNSFTDPNDIYIIRGSGGNKIQFQWYDDSASSTTETFSIDNSGNATFAGSVTATSLIKSGGSSSEFLKADGSTDSTSYLPLAGGTIDGSLIIDTNTGSQPFYVTRSGNPNESLKIYISDENAVFESIQDETADNYGGFIFNMDAGTTHPFFDVRKNNSTIMRVDGGGNVGIGTNSPAEKLDISSGHIRMSDGYKIDWGGTNARIDGSNTDNRLRFFTSGVEKVRIDSSGNVGIGTNSPDTGLHLYGTSNVSSGFTIEQVYGGTSKKFGFQPVYNDDRLDIWYNSNATAGITLKDGGNVGIGTANPSHRLDVESADETVASFNSTDNKCAIALNDDDTTVYLSAENARGAFGFQVGTHANNLNINSSGDVGIGTNSPATKLHVDGNVLFAESGDHMRLRLVADSTDQAIIYFGDPANNYQGRVAYQNSSDSLYFTTAGAEKMRILSGGNVGIGTANPTSILDIRDTQTGGASEIKLFNLDQGNTTTQTSALVMSPDVRANGVKIAAVKENADFSSSANKDVAITFSPVLNNASAEKMRITSDGNVGIGTITPAYKLTVNGDVDINNGALLVQQAYGINLGVSGYGVLMPSTTRVGILTAATERLSILNNGNVGIGTTNPSEKLHVAGNIELQSAWEIGSNDGSYWQRIRTEDSSLSTTNAFNFETRNGSGSFIKHMVIRNDGNVGIGVTNPSYALQVGGSIVGTSKNFIIDHPTKEGKKLLHGCIEGPEAAVYFRGKSTSNIIEMPDYWIGLVDIDTMTVDITPWGPNQDLYVEDISDDGEVTVGSNTEEPLNYFYVVYGERKDIDKLEIEIVDSEYSSEQTS